MLKHNTSFVHSHNIKIKVDLDIDLPLEKTINMYIAVMLIKSVFNKYHNHYYHFIVILEKNFI